MQDTIVCGPTCGQSAAVKRPLVDLQSNTIAWRGRLDVRAQQAEILSILTEQFGRPVAYDRIIARLYGLGDEPADPMTGLTVQVCALRKRLHRIGLRIITVWGRGYALENLSREEAANAA